MARSPWCGLIGKRLIRSSRHHRNTDAIIVLHTNNSSYCQEISSGPSQEVVHSEFTSRESIAAITIQACFRRHLARPGQARRARRALRSLQVRLQAVVRGVLVRRQARIALNCMNALARIQITIPARQLLLDT